MDPKPIEGISEYSAFNNNPIFFNDILGDSAGPPIFPRHPINNASDAPYLLYNRIGLIVNGGQSLVNKAGDYLKSFGKDGAAGVINTANSDFGDVRQGVNGVVDYHLNTPAKQQWADIKDFYSTPDNYAKAFEQAVVIGATWKFGANSFEAPVPAPASVVPTTGRLGNLATRAQIDNIATSLESRGYTITGGGGRLPEEFLKPLGGGRRGGSYLDITATHPTYPTLRLNTVDVTKNGTITLRELLNAKRIRTQIAPGEHLLLIKKIK